jgi:hypothetical protein
MCARSKKRASADYCVFVHFGGVILFVAFNKMNIADASSSLHFVSKGNFMRSFLFIRKIARLAQIDDLLSGSICACCVLF